MKTPSSKKHNSFIYYNLNKAHLVRNIGEQQKKLQAGEC